LVQPEWISKEIRASLLLVVQAAKKQVEQAFGGSHPRHQCSGACEDGGNNEHEAAGEGLRSPVCMQRLRHPIARDPLRRALSSTQP
jgi:hypothetical protein